MKQLISKQVFASRPKKVGHSHSSNLPPEGDLDGVADAPALACRSRDDQVGGWNHHEENATSESRPAMAWSEGRSSFPGTGWWRRIAVETTLPTPRLHPSAAATSLWPRLHASSIATPSPSLPLPPTLPLNSSSSPHRDVVVASVSHVAQRRGNVTENDKPWAPHGGGGQTAWCFLKGARLYLLPTSRRHVSSWLSTSHFISNN